MNSSSSPVLPRYLHSLDVLRGLAALGVVLFHWQHFFYWNGGLQITRLPLYPFLKVFYQEGFRMVDLFFCLSGFIFYWLYSDKIKERKTSGIAFFMLRFSRLYPLHLVTLIIVAVSQFFLLRHFGQVFVYPVYDVYHFILHLGMISSWGFGKDFSFNGPIWSVSTEILVYIVFFAACRLNFRRWWFLALFILIGMVLISTPNFNGVGRCVSGFFAGGLTFYFFKRISGYSFSPLSLKITAAALVVAWLVFPSYELVYQFYRSHIWSEAFNWHGKDVIGTSLKTLLPFILSNFIVCPITILTLGLWETQGGTSPSRLAFLGQISYSSYLIHFPLQLIFATVFRMAGWSFDFFYSPLSFVLFYLVLIPLSICSYRYFEIPCQTAIRKRSQRLLGSANANS